MNEFVIKAIIAHILSGVEEFQKGLKMQSEQNEFFEAKAKDIAKEGDLPNLQLNATDQKKFDKLGKDIPDPGKLFDRVMKDLTSVMNDPKLYKYQYDVKSAYAPSELAKFLDDFSEKHHIVEVTHYTGTNEGDIVYCCAVKYMKFPQGK